MRNPPILLVTACVLAAAACNANSASRPDAGGGATDGHDSGTHASAAILDASNARAAASSSPASPAVFDPPPPRSGYTRIVAPVVENLAAGSESMYCQYVQAPLDRDMDVLDVQGSQSVGGHHAVAYSTTMNVPIGTSRPCNAEDNMSAGFLGGTGGEASGGIRLPARVAFRLQKGSSIMLNTHFVNTTDATIDGHSILDFQFAEVDSKRVIASLFTSGTLGLKVPANAAAEALAECTLPQDMQFILFTNHMHDHGTSAKTEVVRADGSIELVHEDPTWTYEMQFNPDYSMWSTDKPLTIAKGEMLRTRCNWQNTTEAELAYPREMCFGVGFFLSDGSSAPVCINGSWIAR